MRDLLPPLLFDLLRDRYIAGVATAEASFDENRADEDSLTGALGQALAMPIPIIFSDEQATYSVQVSYRKIRGRGHNAPERLYGTDGIFQISVLDENGGVIRQKGLPFQSKTNWRGRRASVVKQARDIQGAFGQGLVIDYSRTGYAACSATAAIASGGNRAEVERQGEIHPLGQLLGNEFLACHIGHIGLYYDLEQERFIRGNAVVPPTHAVTTIIRTTRRTT